MKDKDFIEKFLQSYGIMFSYYQEFKSGWFMVTDAIKELLIEKNIRQNRYALRIKDKPKHFTASSLGNFTFCPASFSIAATFQVDYPNAEKEREAGQRLHERLNLIKRVRNYQKTKTVEHEIFEQEEIINILNSEVIYSGHGENAKRTFFDQTYQIACEPDYIFKDKESNYFIVEEKYHYMKDPRREIYKDYSYNPRGIKYKMHQIERTEKIIEWENFTPYFYVNHKVQLITYLKCIKDYPSHYGYLVYWYYDYDKDKNPYIHKVAVQKIILNSESLYIFNRSINSLHHLVSTGKIVFHAEKLSPFKCSKCVVNKYCGHKTKRYNDISYPYNHNYLELFPSSYE